LIQDVACEGARRIWSW